MTKEPKPPQAVKLTYEDQVKIAQRLPRIADMLEKQLSLAVGKPVLFSLWVWGDGRSQYIANANRDDIKAALQETLDRWEDVEPAPGAKEWN